ncbi:hypothetical protein GCM10022393_23350 [Aquimarina addita]|uniref:DUF4280 domain-containing protein n=1 Tax=Aquimarina addita TaxID=870485 RepID=A0ABP6UKE5_9FLAO
MSQQPTSSPEAEEPAMVEKRISYEGFQIKCDKCKAGKELISMKSTTKTVTIDGKPMVTKIDMVPMVNIPPFSTCDNPMISKCVPALTGWLDIAEETVNTEKFTPLVEHSEFTCTLGGGIVTFAPPTAQSAIMGPKKPNIVDQAKAKINGMVNKVADMAKKVTDGIASEVGGMIEGMRPIGQLFDNPTMQNMITGATGALEQANLSKEQLDTQLASLEQKVPEIKSKISDTINGIEVPSLEDMGIFGSELSTEEALVLQQGIMDSTSELEGYFNNEINSASLINLDGNSSGDFTIPTLSDKGPLENWLDQKKQEQANLDNIAAAEYGSMTEQITTINKDATFDNGDDSKEALSLLYSLYIPSQAGPIPIPGDGEVSDLLTNKAKDEAQNYVDNKINTSKATLNATIQNELDEELKELGYDKAQKEIDELQQKSGDLQKDMDKAEKWLGRMDNYDDFIDGLKTKYTDKITGAYGEAAKKAGANLGLLNVSLDGMSFIVDGLPPGDVVTMVKAKQEKNKKDEEDDSNKNKDGDAKGGALSRSDKEPSLKAYWGSPQTI